MIGVIFATLDEAAPTIARLALDRVEGHAMTTYCGRLPFGGADPVACVICGMGPSAADAGIRYLIEEFRPDTIINAGVAGALTDSPALVPGSVWRIDSVSMADRSTGNVNPFQVDAGPWATLDAARLVTVAEPVFDPVLREELATLGDLVDMEGAALAARARQEGIPCWMLKGVTDAAGAGDRETLHRNLIWVSRRIADALAEGLARTVRSRETDDYKRHASEC